MHGYLASSKTFSYQLAYFKKYFQVFCFDLKGFGENLDMLFPYSLDDYIKEVKTFLNDNNIVKPHVIAHSFGCRIAIKMAAEDPQIFDKMVLTGAAGLKPKNSVKKAIRRTAFKVAKRFIPKEKLTKFYSKDYQTLSPVMQESFKKIVNEHLDGYLNKIENQTLLIFGKCDKETPLYMAKRLNKGIKNSKLSIYDNAGHFCFIDKSAKFNVEVKEFLL